MTPDAITATRLLAISALTALVGQRVYGVRAPQSPTRPYVRVQSIGLQTSFHARGPVGVHETRMQIDAFADTLLEANAVADAVHGDGLGASASGFNGWRGEMGSPPIMIRGVFVLDEREDYLSDELKVYRVSRDYRLIWSD